MNLRNKFRAVLALAAMAMVGFVTNSANADLVSVDFGNGTNPVESGFVGQSATNATHSTTAGDITVDISGQQGLFNFTTTSPNNDLFSDFFFKNGGTITMTLSGAGISASTDYDLTFWSYYGAEGRNTTFDPGAGGTAGPSLGPIAPTGEPTSPTSLTDPNNTISGIYTSDGSGNLVIAVGGTNSRPAINGVRIASAIPEPSSLALIGMGSLVMLVRRRRG